MAGWGSQVALMIMSKGLIILAYHRVLKKPDPLRTGDIPLDCFSVQMQTLARYFNVLPLADAVERLRNGSLPWRAVSITFDDGYEDNYSLAWPVLRKLKLPATIFVASGYLDGGRMWNDTVIEAIHRIPGDVLDLNDLGLGCYDASSEVLRAAAVETILQRMKYSAPDVRDNWANALAERTSSALPAGLMLSSEQVAELSRGGIEIGAHTVMHPILKVASEREAREEIFNGKRRLEEITGQPVRSFAYPNGKPGTDYSDRDVKLVGSAGFDCAVSTTIDVARSSSDNLQLPRFSPWTESPARFGLRLMRMHLQS